MKKVKAMGPSEMKGQGGKTHKGISGPSAMKESSMVKMGKAKHDADLMKSDMHGYLGAGAGDLKSGFKSLEKVSADVLGGKKAGKGKMAREGGGDGNESED